MHPEDDFPAETFRLVAGFEFVREHPELIMGAFIFFVGRTAVPQHALLFEFKMYAGVIIEKIEQLGDKFTFFPARIGGGQQLLQMIHMVDQRPVLLVNLIGTRGELFSSWQHIREIN